MKKSNGVKKSISKKKRMICKNSPTDQANLDLHFVEAFINLLWGYGDLDVLKRSTVSAMCYECLLKLDNIKRFVDRLPYIDSDQRMMEITAQKAKGFDFGKVKGSGMHQA